ncbi:MAG: phosphatase PAP2 family protein [Alphaproteobacteria bacterium]|nr:phosphatase PAP2 family protein [Alphaproteobacteria bacterium]
MAIFFTVKTQPSYSMSIADMGGLTRIMIPVYAFGMSMNEEGWDGAAQFAQSFAATSLAVYGIKEGINARRPDGGDEKSFPSGHTAMAFSGATFIHKRYGLERAIIPYALAGFTGYSRYHAGKHYVHDIAAGALISSVITWNLISRYKTDYDVNVSASPDHVYMGFKTIF